MTNAPGLWLALWLGALLLGSIPSGLLISRLKGIDIRRHGSGNIGTANVYRIAGRGPAALTLLLDALKGLLPVVAGRALGLPAWVLLLAGFLAIAGHNWSIFLHGQGGKGIATSLGAIIGIAPPVALLAVVVWVITVRLSRYASVGSLLMLGSVPPLLVLLGYGTSDWIFGIAIVGLALGRHWPNIIRLRRGTELKISTPSSSGSTTGRAPQATSFGSHGD